MAAVTFPFSTETYIERRKTLMKEVGSGKILLLGNQDASINFKDNVYHFRQDSSFLYYIGINLMDLNAILDCDSGEVHLFGNDASVELIVWMGNQPKLSDLGAKVGIDLVHPTADLVKHLSGDIKYLPAYRARHEINLKSWLGVSELKPNMDLIHAVIKQRNIKTLEEIAELDKAVTLTSQMHEFVLRNAKPNMMEYQLVGLANAFAWNHNCQWSFPPILTKNGQTLHNHYHGHQIKEGDLVLYDGGIEIESGYCGDMTRSFPAGNKFTDMQASIYKIVHDSYQTALDLSKPGIYYKDVHLAVAKTMVNGLKSLGIMQGDTDEAVDAGAHSLFFPHGLGHMMGMDVHDMENLGEEHVGYDSTIEKSTQFGLRSLRLGRELKEGYVITIEPGIYLIPELIDKFKSEGQHINFVDYDELNKYRNMGGIRIEDDYVITADGNRRLGEPLANDLASVEEMRREALS